MKRTIFTLLLSTVMVSSVYAGGNIINHHKHHKSGGSSQPSTVSSVSTVSNTTNANSSQYQNQNQTQNQQTSQYVDSQSSSTSGSDVGVNVNVKNGSDRKVKFPVATASGPALTTSNDTCMGSASGGISTVSVGVSVGTTWTDENCVMLKNSREMWNMGMRQAAVNRMCMDEQNRESMEISGIECPDFDKYRDEKRKQKEAKVAAEKKATKKKNWFWNVD